VLRAVDEPEQWPIEKDDPRFPSRSCTQLTINDPDELKRVARFQIFSEPLKGYEHVRVVSKQGDVKMLVTPLVIRLTISGSNHNNLMKRSCKLEVIATAWKLNGYTAEPKIGTQLQYTQSQWVKNVKAFREAIGRWPADAREWLTPPVVASVDRPLVPPAARLLLKHATMAADRIAAGVA